MRPIHEAEQVQFLLNHVNLELLRCHLINSKKTKKNKLKLLWQHMAVRGNVHCARCLFRIAGGGGAVDEPDLLSISHLLSLALR